MKKTKILFTLILALSLLLLPLSVGAEYSEADAASGKEAYNAEATVDEGVTDTDGTADEAPATGSGEGDRAPETDSSENIPSEKGAEDTEENPFETALRELGDYATEIICTLSLAASLLLAYAYKKGLLPLLNNALSAITKTLSGMKSKTEEGEKELGAGLEKLSLIAAAQEERLERWDGELKAACAALAEVTAECKDTAKVKGVLSAEVELLYDIFMSSSLPQYKKDAVAERIAEMKRGLETDDKE